MRDVLDSGFRFGRARIAFATFLLLVLATVAARAADCSSSIAALYADGTGSAPVADEKVGAELGDDARSCIYTLSEEALEEAVGDCLVTSVTFEGSEPVPRLITINKGWDTLAEQAEVTEADGDLAWSWTGDGMNCGEPGCLDGESAQIHLFGKGLGLFDNVEHCPFTTVQARFTLEAAP